MDPIDRVLRDLGDPDLSSTLAELSGADLTTLLLEVMRRRAELATAPEVMRQRRRDRFVAPGPTDLRSLHRTEALMLDALPEDVTTVVLAPLAPLGLHSAVAGVDQNRLVSTIRRTDVAADPTAGLAIEAALRRRLMSMEDSGREERITLGSIQRVVRAQSFEGPLSWAHFSILGLVTAGRDMGSSRFEIETLAQHASMLADCLLATGADHLTITLSDWTGGTLTDATGLLAEHVADLPVTILDDPARTRARGYYLEGAFEIDVRFGGTTFSAADGGLVDWTRHLVGNRKERLMISGIGVDRVAVARPGGGPPA